MNRIKKRVLIVIVSLLILLQNAVVYADEDLDVDAKAALIVERNTGRIIYEKNSTEENYPASVTKILTAIIVIERCNLDSVATVSETALENIPDGYVTAPLSVGEEIKIRDLLYALMLKSANDAAYVLAEHVGGSIDGFSEIMNEKAKEIGCTKSHFINPNGIHDGKHYTSAYDMFLISNYAMSNEEFVKIVSTYEYTLPATNKYENEDRVMKNTNSFVNPNSSYYNKNVRGIKTGTTTQAGNCLVADVARDGLEFITVVLGAEDANAKFAETEKMIDYSYDNYTLTKVHDKGAIIETIEIDNATDETKSLNLLISDEIIVMNNKKITVDKIIPEIKLNEEIKAPIVSGQELGTIKYKVDDIEYSAKLLAANDVEKKTYYVQIGIGAVAVLACFIVFRRRPKRSNKRQRNIY